MSDLRSTRRAFLRGAAGAAAVAAAPMISASPAGAQPASAVSGGYVSAGGGELPPPILRTISRAQIFDYHISDPSVYDGRVAFVWGAGELEQPTGVMASKYILLGQVDLRVTPLAWFQQNHPDWLAYKADQTTLVQDNSNWVGLDFTNSDVREWYLTTYPLAYAAEGWPAIAFDGILPYNFFAWSGHFDTGGNWVQQFSEDPDDINFVHAQEDWLRYAVDRLHEVGVSVAGNVFVRHGYDQLRWSHGTTLANIVDIWIDEGGFTKAYRPPNPLVGEPDERWQDRFTTIRSLASRKAIVTIEYMATPDVADASEQQVNYAIGSYLLCREAEGMLALIGSSQAGYFVDRPELDFDIGVFHGKPWLDVSGAWMRLYTNGLVVVNPASWRSVDVALPNGSWQDAYGQPYVGSVTVPRTTGLILRCVR